MAQPTLGVYRIISQLNTDYVLDVYGASTETNAKVQLYGHNDTSAQKIKLTKGYQDNDNYRRMQFQCSGKCAYAPKGESPTDNTLVRQYPPGGTDDLDWSFTQDTTKSNIINGVTYYPYEVTFRYVSTLRLDDAGARVTASNDIVTYTDNNTDAQRWILMKDSYKMDKWTIPGITLMAGSSGYKEAVPVDTSEARTLKFTNSTTFQMRYKYRTLAHNTNTWSDWSNWYSPSDTLTDEGWGDAWSKNSTQTNTVYIQAANSSPTLSTTPHDSVEYIVEARTFGTYSSSPAHSASNTKSIVTKQLLETDITSASITANGLSLDYTTDAYRTCDKMQVIVSPIYQNKTVLYKGGTFDVADTSSGTIHIPFDQLEFMPAKGSSVKVTMKFAPVSKYITTTTTTETLTITYSGGDLTPVINLTQVDDYTVKFTISEQDGKPYNTEYASFIYEHDGKAVIHQLTKEDGYYTLLTPLNKEYHIFAELEYKSGSTIESWGAKYAAYTSPKCESIVINTANTMVEFDKFKADSEYITKSKDVTTETAKLEGQQYESVYYSTVQSSKLALDGAVFPVENKPYIESALNDGYCLVRDFRGLYSYCAITSVNYTDINDKYTSVQIDFTEIQNEIDVAIPY